MSGECLDHEAHERTRKARKAFVCLCAGHVRQLRGESPLHNLVEVKC